MRDSSGISQAASAVPGAEAEEAVDGGILIRVPHHAGRRSVEVLYLHLRAGARVETGTPVLTFTAGGKSQTVRAPRRGKATPLVTVGDRLVTGDLLYRLDLLPER